jgi:hypothetical protein
LERYSKNPSDIRPPAVASPGAFSCGLTLAPRVLFVKLRLPFRHPGGYCGALIEQAPVTDPNTRRPFSREVHPVDRPAADVELSRQLLDR